MRYAELPCLADIVGQPPARHLTAYVTAVRRQKAASKCIALVGDPGTGKTASALATARELDCTYEVGGMWGGLLEVDCSQFGVDKCDELFRSTLRLRPQSELGWKVLILDEFERISPACQVKLKFWLDDSRLLPKLTVIATSNDLDGISEALLDRFDIMPYESGVHFMAACQQRLKSLWSRAVHGEGLPDGMTAWGRTIGRDGFSMRAALRCLEEALAERECVPA